MAMEMRWICGINNSNMVAASWRIYDWIKWMQYGTFVAENLWRMKLKDCWILLATSMEFHDGGTTMDGENIYIYIYIYILFAESWVRFFQLCLLNFFFIVLSGFLEAEFRWKIKGKLWHHKWRFLWMKIKEVVVA